MKIDTNSKFTENSTLIMLSFAVGFAFFDRLGINFLFPYIATEFSLNQTHLGLLSSAVSLTVALSGIFLSNFAEKIGKKKLLIILVILLGIGSFFQSFANSFATLLIMRIIMGLVIGLFVPICQSLMSEASSNSRRGINMGIVQGTSVALIASALAPVLLVRLATRFGWRSGFYVLLVPCLILSLSMFKFLIDPTTSLKKADPNSSSNITTLLKNHNIILCFLISVGMLTWYLNLAAFIPSYLTSEAGRSLSDSQMSFVSVGLGFGGAFWGLVVPLISDKWGRKPTTYLFSLFSCLSPLAIMFVPGSPLIIMLLLCLFHAGQGVTTLSISTIPSESLPPELIATAIGIISGGGELIAGVLIPTIAGWASESIHVSVPLWIGCFGALLAGLCSFLLTETAPSKI